MYIVSTCVVLFFCCLSLFFFFFFFKQKTAYEMRISDWSSDVCSSDLPFQAQQFGALDDADEERQQDRQHERELHRRVAALVAQDLPGRCHRQPPGAGGNESTLYGSFWKATVETRRRPASPLGITVSIKGVENFQRYMDRTTVTAQLPPGRKPVFTTSPSSSTSIGIDKIGRAHV